jgi:hypothetical protein
MPYQINQLRTRSYVMLFWQLASSDSAPRLACSADSSNMRLSSTSQASTNPINQSIAYVYLRNVVTALGKLELHGLHLYATLLHIASYSTCPINQQVVHAYLCNAVSSISKLSTCMQPFSTHKPAQCPINQSVAHSYLRNAVTAIGKL